MSEVGFYIGSRPIYNISKRFLDIFVSLFGILFFSPFMVFIAVLIIKNSPGGVFYYGVRAGKNNTTFKIIKFRTMVKNAENIGGYSTSIDDARLTKIGRFLRKYKIDELPQFFNVIKGDMSLVGPRPQVCYYTNKYKGELKLILSVKPGITDLASLYFSDMDKVLGDGLVDKKYEDEIEPVKNLLRLNYVKKQSFILDMRILIETVFSILGIKNITRLNIKP